MFLLKKFFLQKIRFVKIFTLFIVKNTSFKILSNLACIYFICDIYYIHVSEAIIVIAKKYVSHI